MEIHQLRYFIAVADLGNFTRAAERCFVAQPSLSQQIIKLENELGGPLLERGGRMVRLTDSGRRFYDRAVEILASVDNAMREMHESADTGRVVVGAIPTIAPYLLPPVLQRFMQRFPRAEVSVYENVTEFTLKACLDGLLDFGILALPVQDSQLAVEPLFTEELLLALAADHPLADRSRVAMKDIVGERFVLLSEAHCLGEQVLSFCRQKSCLPVVSCHGAQLLTVQELVALGHGISLIPQMAVDVDKSRRRRYRSLSGDKPFRTIAMIWKKHRYQSPLVLQFLETVREEARRHGHSKV